MLEKDVRRSRSTQRRGQLSNVTWFTETTPWYNMTQRSLLTGVYQWCSSAHMVHHKLPEWGTVLRVNDSIGLPWSVNTPLHRTSQKQSNQLNLSWRHFPPTHTGENKRRHKITCFIWCSLLLSFLNPLTILFEPYSLSYLFHSYISNENIFIKKTYLALGTKLHFQKETSVKESL